ncbi:hypothetical protein [Spiroplasma sp. Moj]|uniref:hypothetical protein n=1 Tax=Spiroplasma sp. Moj TaxID=1922342 RepID=UPI0039F11C7B
MLKVVKSISIPMAVSKCWRSVFSKNVFLNWLLSLVIVHQVKGVLVWWYCSIISLSFENCSAVMRCELITTFKLLFELRESIWWKKFL